MNESAKPDLGFDRRLARRLATLRAERGWSLDELAARSSVSRATLSRLEKTETSPTANVLGKLCAAYGLPMSRLMLMVEEGFAPLVSEAEQETWIDPETGYQRRSVSPPAGTLVGEVLCCEMPAGTCIEYDKSPKPGLEHHLVMIDGRLALTIDEATYELRAGDCLRYRLTGSSAFRTPVDLGAKYHLFIV
jgi:transcriptional regulator with XRE-family HTH domain